MFLETEPGTLGRVFPSPPPQAWAGPSPGPPRLVPSFQTDSLVNADLLYLGHQHLQQAHDGLERQLRLPGQDL